jgi:hypothetical protein
MANPCEDFALGWNGYGKVYLGSDLVCYGTEYHGLAKVAFAISSSVFLERDFDTLPLYTSSIIVA